MSADTPRFQLTGQVIDNLTGRPVAHAAVDLSTLCQASTDAAQTPDRIPGQAVTDDEGRFTFDNVPDIPVSLRADRENYGQVWAFRRTPADPVQTLQPSAGPFTLRLAPLPSIQGVVRAGNGTPLAHAWVTLWHYQSWYGWRRLEYGNTLETSANGSYHFGPLQPGRYFLVAQAWLGFRELAAPGAAARVVDYVPLRFPPAGPAGSDSFFDLAEGQHARVDFKLRRAELHRVAGTVHGRQQWPPIIDAVDANGSQAYVLQTDGDCCGFSAWLPAGHFVLQSNFTSSDGAFTGSLPLDVPDYDVPDYDVPDYDLPGIDFPLTRNIPVELPIEIVAVPGTHADPVCRAWFLQLIEHRPNGYNEAGPQSTQAGWMRCNTPSRTESITVPPGSYATALTVSGNVYARNISYHGVDLLREPLILNSGGSPDTIHLVVAEGAIVEGVTRREGQPVRAWVYAIAEQPDGRLLQPVASDSTGKFRLEGLAPERYLIFASEVELSIDMHNLTDVGSSRGGKNFTLEAGRVTSLDLELTAQ